MNVLCLLGEQRNLRVFFVIYRIVLDLSLFSTKALLDAHADHEVEVRTQVSSLFTIAFLMPLIQYMITRTTKLALYCG